MDYFDRAIAAACGAVISFFTGMPPLMWALIWAMTLDYVTGIICAWMGKSPKTQGGGLSSRAAFEGLMKKVVILIVVGLAALIDYAVASSAGMVSFSAIKGAVCLWFIASEGLSILENAAEMDVLTSDRLRQALEVMRGSGDKGKSE